MVISFRPVRLHIMHLLPIFHVVSFAVNSAPISPSETVHMSEGALGLHWISLYSGILISDGTGEEKICLDCMISVVFALIDFTSMLAVYFSGYTRFSELFSVVFCLPSVICAIGVHRGPWCVSLIELYSFVRWLSVCVILSIWYVS